MRARSRIIRRRPSSRSGFTLIEVLVATIIFAFITMASGFALSTALRSQAAMRQKADLQQEIRGIASVLGSDIRSAYASANNPNTLFISGGSAPGALLTFTTLSGRVIVPPDQQNNSVQGNTAAEVPSPPQSDLRTITYAHDPQSGTLSRIESIVPGTDAAAMAASMAGAPQTILSRHVLNISFEFYDAQNQAVRQDWEYSNDPNQAQGGAQASQTTDTSLPQSVHVELDIATADGRVEHQSLVIPLQTPAPAPAGQTPPAATTGTGGTGGGGTGGGGGGSGGGGGGGGNGGGGGGGNGQKSSLPGLSGLGPRP